ENVRALTSAIEALQEKERLVISLYYVEELNMNQIAEVMEISQPRVSQLHSIAIRKLRKYMDEHGEG
ncbi:MAG: sigma-70 family RNA polymerase sigma factor, partial [Oribacterium parvum]|nr:sigma-70 family RNA polymerase sigma factor [Oribacterium parvum]